MTLVFKIKFYWKGKNKNYKNNKTTTKFTKLLNQLDIFLF